MAVDAAGEFALGVVEVHGTQVVEAHHLAQLVQRGGTCLGSAQVVAGGEGVTGIDTHSYSGFIIDLFNDFSQVLEAPAQVGALPRRVLDYRDNVFGFGQGKIDRFGDAAETIAFADLLEVATRVKVE